jgi:hypothetical protein
LAANIGYNAASPFSWKEIQLFENTVRIDLGYHPLRLHQRQQLCRRKYQILLALCIYCCW